MGKWLACAALAWPLALGGAVWQRGHHQSPASWTAAVYLAASRVCHQRPERSFHTAGVQWPVCGRCAGLYLAAPFGAILGLTAYRQRRHSDRVLLWLAIASVPTIATLALEWTGLAPINNVERLLAALPLGAAIAAVIVRTVRNRVSLSEI